MITLSVENKLDAISPNKWDLQDELTLVISGWKRDRIRHRNTASIDQAFLRVLSKIDAEFVEISLRDDESVEVIFEHGAIYLSNDALMYLEDAD